MEDKVKVKSLVSSRVVISIPDMRLRRIWEKKGAVKVIPFEQLEEAMYNPGVEALFKEGVLGIDDMEVKVKLGLEPEGAVEPVNIIVLDDKQRERYLKVLPMHEFRQKMKELPKEQIMELANYAIEHEIADFDKSELILKVVGIDILSAIKLNRDDKAAMEAAKED
jgi:hypothetical protein